MKTKPLKPILVIDDDPETLKSLELLLYTCGYNNILLCSDSRKVINTIEEKEISLVLLDIIMPHISGEELLVKLKQEQPHIPVIIITGTHDIDMAVRCMKQGAYDFFLKPVQKNVFAVAVKRALENWNLKQELGNLRRHVLNAKIDRPEVFSVIITQNANMLAIFRYIEAIAPSSEAVLITGESGVGKELVARALHELSQRQGDFITVNIAGLDDQLFTDTLFGHKKGAFTGANSMRQGLVEKAMGGTLFLDEIGDLSPASQVKLLRLLQEGEFYALGADNVSICETRIVVATNHNLTRKLEQGEFRKDLFYRLKTHHVHIPPLRERLGDLPLLVDHFLDQAGHSLGREGLSISAQAGAYLANYDFPGNIRELRSILIDATSRATQTQITEQDLIPILGMELKEGIIKVNPVPGLHFEQTLPTLKQAGELLIDEALNRTGGNQSAAALLLGITHQALSKRLKQRKQ